MILFSEGGRNVHEYDDNNKGAVAVVASIGEGGCEAHQKAVCDQHAGQRGDEERASANALNAEGGREGEQEIPNR